MKLKLPLVILLYSITSFYTVNFSDKSFRAIVERDVSDREFLEQLHELQHKLQFLKAQEFRDAKATSDVHDVIENLKYKVS